MGWKDDEKLDLECEFSGRLLPMDLGKLVVAKIKALFYF